jgi:type I restriction enzyme S subunit
VNSVTSAIGKQPAPTSTDEYQETDLGRIPADWTIRRVGQLSKLVNGRGFKPYEWRTRGLPIIRIQNLNGSDEFNYFDGPYNKKIEVHPDQLLFAWSGSKGTSFGPHIWKGPLGVLNYHTWKVVVDRGAVSEKFFYHALKGLTEFIEGWAHGASALVHVQKWQMEGFQLAVPSLREQDAIAEALSDLDALISALEGLIAKKRAIKQGTMEELLSGQRRLPGFKEPWHEKTLFELAGYQKEDFDDGDWVESQHIVESGIRLIQTGNIGIGDFVESAVKKYISETSFKLLRCKEIRAGDLLVCRLADPAGRACILPDIAEQRIITSVDVTIFRPLKEEADREYLKQVFCTSDWFQSVSDRSGGTTHKRISRGALGRITIRLPSVAEQESIGSLLKDMDVEIASLQATLAKARLIKQGMMKELLSGGARLV